MTFEPLSEVAEIVMGQSPPSSSYNSAGSGLPFFQGKTDFGDLHPQIRLFCNEPTKIAERGDILISVRAPVGPTNIAPARSCIGRGLAAIRCSAAMDAKFLLYFLRYREPQIAQLGRGSTFEAINRDDLEDLSVLVPPPPEQKRIARLLEKGDRLRHTRRYALELSDIFLPAAFLQLFGDPATNPCHFPMETVDSIFSKQREGAKCGPFGSALKKHEYVPQGIPVWTMENVGENEFREDGCLYITPQKFEELKAYDVQNGDILVSRAGTVGRMAIVKTKNPRSIIHSNIIRLSLDSSRCLPIYFTVLMTYFADRVGRLKRGQEDAYTFMNTGRLAELRIPVPPLSMQMQFAKQVARHERLRAVQRESLRQAEHLFQTLLHRAFAEHL